MNLIDAHHGDLPPIFGEVLDEEPLRRYEQYLDLFLSYSLQYGLLCGWRLLRVDSGTRDELRQFIELVGHQGYQRGDHQYQTRLEHRSILIDEGLTSASGQHNQSVLLFLQENLESL